MDAETQYCAWLGNGFIKPAALLIVPTQTTALKQAHFTPGSPICFTSWRHPFLPQTFSFPSLPFPFPSPPFPSLQVLWMAPNGRPDVGGGAEDDANALWEEVRGTPGGVTAVHATPPARFLGSLFSNERLQTEWMAETGQWRRCGEDGAAGGSTTPPFAVHVSCQPARAVQGMHQRCNGP